MVTNKKAMPITEEKVQKHLLKKNRNFPNNPRLEVVILQGAIKDNEAPATVMEETFRKNGWSNSWRNGIFNYHHYHSNTHEVLGVFSGSAKVVLGGPDGLEAEVSKGDVIVLPAGTAHKRVSSSGDFQVVGAYPGGAQHDMNYGKEEELQKSEENIKHVAIPEKDPVFGEEGPLIRIWSQP